MAGTVFRPAIDRINSTGHTVRYLLCPDAVVWLAVANDDRFHRIRLRDHLQGLGKRRVSHRKREVAKVGYFGHLVRMRKPENDHSNIGHVSDDVSGSVN